MAGDKKLTVTLLGDAKGLTSTLAEAGTKVGEFGAKAAAGLAIGGGAVLAAGTAIAGGLFKIGESFDSAYDKIRIGTGKTGDVLDGLKNDFKAVLTTVPTDMGKASDAITQLFQRTGANGPVLQGLAEQMLELSRITDTDLTANVKSSQDAFNAWGVDVANQPKLLDELFRATQASGQSFDSIASSIAGAQPQLKAAGFSFETSAALAATLGQAGSSLEDVMPALGKAMAAAAKDGKSSQVVFRDTFDAIRKAPDSTKAAGVALEVFGAKAGPKLAEMIRSGKLGYDELLKTMQGGKDTIIGAGAETQDFAEKWQLIKNRVLVALEPLAMKVFDGVGKAMDKLGPYVDRVAAWFSKELPVAFAYLEPKAKAVFGWLQQHVPPILEAVRNAAVRTFEWLRANVPPILDKIATFIRTQVVPAMEALAGWVEKNLVPALEKLWKSFRDNILPILEKVAKFIATEVLPRLFDIGKWILEHVLPIVGKLVTFILGDLIPAFFKIVNYITTDLLPKIANVGKWFKNHIIDPGGDVIDFFRELPGKIGSFFATVGDTIAAPFRAAFNAIGRLWNNTVGKISFSIPDWVPIIGGKSWGFPTIDVGGGGATSNPPAPGPGSGAGPIGPVGPASSYLAAPRSVFSAPNATATQPIQATFVLDTGAKLGVALLPSIQKGARQMGVRLVPA